ncbi:MAG: tetratricopeptide repeat protein [Polyangiaceae bacterium]|nr:tetratricopeptide repeat protein [Polyangiaceae bacterium]
MVLLGLLLPAGGGVIAASQAGLVSIPLLDEVLGPVMRKGVVSDDVSSPPVATAPWSVPESNPSAVPAGSASAGAADLAREPPGPDADYAETVREAPLLAKVLATRGPIPNLTNASVRQLVALAEDANRHGAVEDALHYVALALEREPRSLAARAAHVRILLRFGDTPAALAQTDEYVADTPSAELSELRGDALAARGRFADARAAWVAEPSKEAIARAKSVALNGGRMRAQKGQVKEAKRFFRRAAVLDMNDLEALLALAELLLVEKDPKPAAAWATQASKVAPQVGAPYSLLGRALVALGDSTNALAAFERAVKYNPSDRASVRELVRLRGAPIP